MTTRRRGRTVGGLVAAVVAVAALAVALAGCADAPVTPAPVTPASAGPPAATPTGSSTVAAPADQHAADVAYAGMMMPHVVQGVELTGMVPGRAADPALLRLALTMNEADVEEQGQLVGQLTLWHAPVPGQDGVPLARMPGMSDAATLDRLRSLSGPAFDRAWLPVMIAHHRGGVDMSRAYLAAGSGQALAGVAETQVGTGTRQIGEMQALGAMGSPP